MAGTQSLFDTLAGGFGHGVDRPALESFVANSQSMNGLRTAQTEEALNNAQKQQEEMQAHADLENSLASTLGDDGKPLLAPSQAHLVANELKGHFGDAKTVMEALRGAQIAKNTGVLSNPANLNTPAMTAAIAGNTNKAPEAVAVPNEYAVPPGMTPPVVQQTPLGAAETAEHMAGANLKTHSANASPESALSDDAAYNAAVRYNQFGTIPPLGMKNSGDRQKILTFAAYMSHDPNWHPPSWDNPQNPPAIAALGGGGGGGGVPNPTGTTAHPTLADATNAAVNPLDAKAQAATLSDMTKRTSIADSSEQTALKNLGLAREMLSKADQTGSPLANTIQNKIRSGMFGDPDVSAYQNAISTARNEYARVISMATGAQGITDYAMKEGQKLFPDDLAPAQFESNFAAAQREMANRTGSMHDQIAKTKAGLHGNAAPSPSPAAPAAPAGGAIPLDQYLKSKGF
jgi:hypothetical protein